MFSYGDFGKTVQIALRERFPERLANDFSLAYLNMALTKLAVATHPGEKKITVEFILRRVSSQ